jgi:AcrR family transcriptional regulator
MKNGKKMDTKAKILNAAEKLFADHGFSATSLRQITTKAKVNLAAVNYHFGSKEALIEAAISRRLEPINRERLELLDRLEDEAGEGGPALDQIVEVFIGTPLRLAHSGRKDGSDFMRLLARVMSDPGEYAKLIFAERLRETVQRFGNALSRRLTGLSEEDLLWRLLFMAGTMIHTMSASGHLHKIAERPIDASDVEAIIKRLVPFLTAGLRASSPMDATGGE